MEKEYVVPEDMMGAATTATVDKLHVQIPPPVQRCALVAALRWLAENPIVPSNKQCAAMLEEFNNPHSKQPEIDRFIATEWQRRMFLEPELLELEEHPALAMLLCEAEEAGWDRKQVATLGATFKRAYRYGREDGAKNGRT